MDSGGSPLKIRPLKSTVNRRPQRRRSRVKRGMGAAIARLARTQSHSLSLLCSPLCSSIKIAKNVFRGEKPLFAWQWKNGKMASLNSFHLEAFSIQAWFFSLLLATHGRAFRKRGSGEWQASLVFHLCCVFLRAWSTDGKPSTNGKRAFSQPRAHGNGNRVRWAGFLTRRFATRFQGRDFEFTKD